MVHALLASEVDPIDSDIAQTPIFDLISNVVGIYSYDE